MKDSHPTASDSVDSATPKRPRRRIYRWAFLILVLLHVHALGYFGRAFKPTVQEDRAVILAALHHFGNLESSRRVRGEGLAPIFLIKEAGSMGSLFLWLNFATWPRFHQMRSSFKVRNQGEFIHSWKGTELVHVQGEQESPEFDSTFNEGRRVGYRCFARAARPGYSRDGRFAQLYVTFGPSSHGAEATFILRRDGNSWSVIAQDIAFFA